MPPARRSWPSGASQRTRPSGATDAVPVGPPTTTPPSGAIAAVATYMSAGFCACSSSATPRTGTTRMRPSGDSFSSRPSEHSRIEPSAKWSRHEPSIRRSVADHTCG